MMAPSTRLNAVLLPLTFAVGCRSGAPAIERSAAITDPAAVVAFVDVSVVPMDGERVLRRHTVVVQRGHITAIGPTSSTTVARGALRIDGKGHYLLPGLADMHTHAWETNDLLLYLANGVTTIRNMWGTIYHLDWKDKIDKGLMLGPKVFTSGPLLDGARPRWPRPWSLRSAAEVTAAVRYHKRLGYDFIKTYDTLSAETFAALASSAKEANIPVVGHVPFAVGLHGALRAMASIEHLTGFAAAAQSDDSPIERPVADHLTRARAWQTVDDAKLRAVSLEAKRAGVYVCPTLSVLEVRLNSETVAAQLRRPEIKELAPGTRWDWWPPGGISKDIKAYVELLRRARGGMARATRALAAAGVPLLLGTDAGFYFVLPGYAVHDELRLLVQAGLTPYEALRTATVNAAAFLGRRKKAGTVSVGKEADLVLVEKNPFEDVGNLRHLVGVMRSGRWLPAKELKKRVRQLAEGGRALEL